VPCRPYCERVSTDQPARRAEPAEEPLLRQLATLPNMISLVRLALVPVFLWLLLGPRWDGLAILLLVFAGISDWLDGKLARWLGQLSRLGQLLDPAADRLYIVATLLAFLVRDILPWWVIAVLVGRELTLGVCVLVLRRRRFTYPEVTYVGKGATFVLMYAFPTLLFIQTDFADPLIIDVLRPVGYAFMIWGGVLYVWSGVLYVVQTWLAVRHRPSGGDERPRNAVAGV